VGIRVSVNQQPIGCLQNKKPTNSVRFIGSTEETEFTATEGVRTSAPPSRLFASAALNRSCCPALRHLAQPPSRPHRGLWLRDPALASMRRRATPPRPDAATRPVPPRCGDAQRRRRGLNASRPGPAVALSFFLY